MLTDPPASSLEALHEDVHLAEEVTQLSLHRLALEQKRPDGEQLVVAAHALVVPVAMRRGEEAARSHLVSTRQGCVRTCQLLETGQETLSHSVALINERENRIEQPSRAR